MSPQNWQHADEQVQPEEFDEDWLKQQADKIARTLKKRHESHRQIERTDGALAWSVLHVAARELQQIHA